MNYLAHFFLAEQSYDSIVGNFIADFIKGPVPSDLTSGIRKGIWMHRKIDVFTDQHPQVKKTISEIDPKYGRFRGIMLDIYYDHILAIHFEKYAGQSLEDFSKFVFQAFTHNWTQLPDKVRNLAPYIIKMNWLTGYRELENIGKALERFNLRSKRAPDFSTAINELTNKLGHFEESFFSFFPDLILYADSLADKDFS